jgi:hypothetical protein
MISSNEELLVSPGKGWMMIRLPQRKGESETTQRPSMADLEYSLVNTIIQNGQDISQLDTILEDLRTREELLIYRVTDADSEQAYTKGCMMRFLGLACKKFGIKPVQFRLLPALNSSLAVDESETAAGPSIIEVFRCSSAHTKLSQIKDVLHIDSFLKKPHTDQKPRRQQLFAYNVTNSHTIDRTWIPAFVVSVAKLVISMQDTTPTWADVVATVQDLVTESFSMLQGGWMEAGLCLAAIVLMEGEGTQLTGLTANTVASMLRDKLYVLYVILSSRSSHVCTHIFPPLPTALLSVYIKPLVWTCIAASCFVCKS